MISITQVKPNLQDRLQLSLGQSREIIVEVQGARREVDIIAVTNSSHTVLSTDRGTLDKDDSVRSCTGKTILENEKRLFRFWIKALQAGFHEVQILSPWREDDKEGDYFEAVRIPRIARWLG